jgi:hypothetical protein
MLDISTGSEKLAEDKKKGKSIIEIKLQDLQPMQKEPIQLRRSERLCRQLYMLKKFLNNHLERCQSTIHI